MKFSAVIIFIFLTTFVACEKNNDNSPVTIHCDGLITDTLGTNDNGRIYMPNAFTPNADGINDVIKPIIQNIASIQFSIYDENSNVVFSTSTTGQGWNTTVAANSYVKYYYRIQATTTANH